MSTNRIGEVTCDKQRCTWAVYTDGKAYADTNKHPYCAYRWPDGSWRPYTVPPFPFASRVTTCDPVHASGEMEKVFSNYVAGIIVSPVDPQRHLK